MQRGPLERRHTPFGLRGQELLVLAGGQGSGIYLSPLTPPRCSEALVEGGAARLEDVEPHHRPAESLEVIVDVEGQSAVAPPSLGPAGALAAGPSLTAAAIEDHLDRGISGEGPLRILVELVPVAGDAFDVMFRANVRNVRLLRRWMEKQPRA